jgi:hypothetical protein
VIPGEMVAPGQQAAPGEPVASGSLLARGTDGVFGPYVSETDMLAQIDAIVIRVRLRQRQASS